jgi:hypothetical protein
LHASRTHLVVLDDAPAERVLVDDGREVGDDGRLADLLRGEEEVACIRLEGRTQRLRLGHPMVELVLILVVEEQVEAGAELALARVHPLDLELALLWMVLDHL